MSKAPGIARPHFYWKGLHVQYIVPWSSEVPLGGLLIRTSFEGVPGIGYLDELPVIDRRHGALWIRKAVAPGKGEALLDGVHPLRQRQAMAHSLCQVCGHGTLDALWEFWGERQLVVMRSLKAGDVIDEGEITTSPTIHLGCALESVSACKHLLKGWTAALVKYAVPWGVAGILHDRRTLQPLLEQGQELTYRPFGHADYSWIKAARKVMRLEGVTAVDLRELAAEAEAAGLPLTSTG
ncbi:hypothetical protein ACFYWO_01345 [Streptomyces sp. NPDC002932]|uniref:hypothetical protein n=1 Tax=Streptomyces sp. NPDC002932 TaxID=3364672 RepID=UPI0036C5837F